MAPRGPRKPKAAATPTGDVLGALQKQAGVFLGRAGSLGDPGDICSQPSLARNAGRCLAPAFFDSSVAALAPY